MAVTTITHFAFSTTYVFNVVVAASQPEAAAPLVIMLCARFHAQLMHVRSAGSMSREDTGRAAVVNFVWSMVHLTAVSCISVFQRMASRRVAAGRLQQAVPTVSAAIYAADGDERIATLRRVSKKNAPCAHFLKAVALAPDVGLDHWALHFTGIEHEFTESNLALLGWVCFADGTLNEFEEALLTEPMRLRHAVLVLAFNAVPFCMHSLLAMTRLVVKAESRLWYAAQREQRIQPFVCDAHGVLDSDSELFITEGPMAPVEVVEHNTEILLDLRVAMRAFHHVLPTIDPRSFLQVCCDAKYTTFVDVHAQSGAAAAWRAAVLFMRGSRLALLAPPLSQCFLRPGIPPRDIVGGEGAEAVFLTASRVWAEELTALLIFERGGSTVARTQVHRGVIVKNLSLLKKLSGRDIVRVLLLCSAQPLSGVNKWRAPLELLLPLIDAAVSELCGRVMYRFSARVVHHRRRISSLNVDATDLGVGNMPSDWPLQPSSPHVLTVSGDLRAWRLTSSLRAHVRMPTWLHARAAMCGDCNVLDVSEQQFACAWIVAAGQATAELPALVQYASAGNGAAVRRAMAVHDLLPQWRAELARRDLLSALATPGFVETSEAARSLATLIEYCTNALIHRLVAGAGETAYGATHALEQILKVIQATTQRSLADLIAFAHYQGHQEAKRHGILRLLNRMASIITFHSVAPQGSVVGVEELVDNDAGLMLRLHARSVLRAVFSLRQSPAALLSTQMANPTNSSGSDQREVFVDRVFPLVDWICGDRYVLRTELGAAFWRLCRAWVEPAATHSAVQPFCKLVAMAALLDAWRAAVKRFGRLTSSVPTPNTALSPFLHTECASLLHMGLELCGSALLVPLRRALTTGPTLTLPEETILGTAVHENAFSRSASKSNSSAAVVTHNVACTERTCISFALHSNWRELNDLAICVLAWSRRPPLPDLCLLQLLIGASWLPYLAMTNFRLRSLHALSKEGRGLRQRAVRVLSTPRLYGQSGAVVMHHSCAHPAVQSGAAKLVAVGLFRDGLLRKSSWLDHALH